MVFKTKMLLATSIFVALGLVLGGLYVFDRRSEQPHGPRPLFANKWVGNPETGRYGWMYDSTSLSNGTKIAYDEEFNLLVVGKSDKELVLVGREGNDVGASYLADGREVSRVRIPFRRDSATLFDRSGVIQIVNLENTRARDLFKAIDKDRAEIGKIFHLSAPPPNSPW